MKAQNLGFDYTIRNTSHTQKVDVKKVQTENISEIKLFFLADMQRSLRLFSAMEYWIVFHCQSTAFQSGVCLRFHRYETTE